MRVYDEDEFVEAVGRALKNVDRNFHDEAPWESAVRDWYIQTGESAENFSRTELKTLAEYVDQSELTEGEAIEMIDTQLRFRRSGPTSKVDFWAERAELDDVSYDLPWPHEDHEMAIRSTATLAKLRDVLDS